MIPSMLFAVARCLEFNDIINSIECPFLLTRIGFTRGLINCRDEKQLHIDESHKQKQQQQGHRSARMKSTNEKLAYKRV